MIGEDSTLERPPGFDKNDFFIVNGEEALVQPEDLEAAIAEERKPYLTEVERYWLKPPYSFAVIFRSARDNELKYYVVEPTLTEKEREFKEFLDDQLRIELDFGDWETGADKSIIAERIQQKLFEVLQRFDLVDRETLEYATEAAAFQKELDDEDDDDDLGWRERLIMSISQKVEKFATEKKDDGIDETDELDVVRTGGEFRETLGVRQVDKLTYYLLRDWIGYYKIDPFMNDQMIEDISFDGYGENIFIDHSRHETLWTNVSLEEDEADSFIKRLAQSSGKGISKRQPEVDAILDNGSRAHLVLGTEITTKGSNFTIRQFKDIPYTPVDLINWNTYNLDQMAYLWLGIQYDRSMIMAGGTASGKTTSMNALSLFIPSITKIVSIEDTPELTLPQKNWVASVTRETGPSNDQEAKDEYDLLKSALRQRPRYIIMGEVRGREGQTLFQAMSSGHTTFTTFHADSTRKLINRFTTDPINVSPTYFSDLDIIVIQKETRVDGDKVRRADKIVEVGEYDAESEQVQYQSKYEWDAATDSFNGVNESEILGNIAHQNGWSDQEFQDEFLKRQIVLAYLVREGFQSYAEVAGVLQAFMHDEEAILHLIATERLGEFVEQMEAMDTIEIGVDDEREEAMNRPQPDGEIMRQCDRVLDRGEDLLKEYKSVDIGDRFAQTATVNGPGSLEEPDAGIEEEATEDDADEMSGEGLGALFGDTNVHPGDDKSSTDEIEQSGEPSQQEDASQPGQEIAADAQPASMDNGDNQPDSTDGDENADSTRDDELDDMMPEHELPDDNLFETTGPAADNAFEDSDELAHVEDTEADKDADYMTGTDADDRQPEDDMSGGDTEPVVDEPQTDTNGTSEQSDETDGEDDDHATETVVGPLDESDAGENGAGEDTEPDPGGTADEPLGEQSSSAPGPEADTETGMEQPSSSPESVADLTDEARVDEEAVEAEADADADETEADSKEQQPAEDVDVDSLDEDDSEQSAADPQVEDSTPDVNADDREEAATSDMHEEQAAPSSERTEQPPHIEQEDDHGEGQPADQNDSDDAASVDDPLREDVDTALDADMDQAPTERETGDESADEETPADDDSEIEHPPEIGSGDESSPTSNDAAVDEAVPDDEHTAKDEPRAESHETADKVETGGSDESTDETVDDEAEPAVEINLPPEVDAGNGAETADDAGEDTTAGATSAESPERDDGSYDPYTHEIDGEVIEIDPDKCHFIETAGEEIEQCENKPEPNSNYCPLRGHTDKFNAVTIHDRDDVLSEIGGDDD